MFRRLTSEARALVRAVAALDRQTVVVLVLGTALGMWRDTFGSQHFFSHHVAPALGVSAGSLGDFVYRFGTMGLVGLVLPVAVLWGGFGRRPSEIGLGLGDWKLALTLFSLYLPLVLVGCWIVSDQTAFQQKYPLFHATRSHWRLFFAYEALFVFYWLGWEYLWRGFVLFGTARTFGAWAVFVQMIPFAALHASKPIVEAYLSIGGGLLLGAIVWRCRSFWVAPPIHFVQMMSLDLFLTLRTRSGASGIGIGALLRALHHR